MRRSTWHLLGRQMLTWLVRFAILMAFWFILSGNLRGWWFGAAICGMAAAMSAAMLPPLSQRLRLTDLLRFIPFFIITSFLGGLDVGRRAVRRKLDLQPVFITYPLQLKSRPAGICFILSVSLLPGTLSCRLADDHVEVHVLDRSMKFMPVLRELEKRIGAIFGDYPAP